MTKLSIIRDFISEAALLVKVMAMISSGDSTVSNSIKKRCVSSSVLPAPAGASTINESCANACSRLKLSSCNKISNVASLLIAVVPNYYVDAQIAIGVQVSAAMGLHHKKSADFRFQMRPLHHHFSN